MSRTINPNVQQAAVATLDQAREKLQHATEEPQGAGEALWMTRKVEEMLAAATEVTDVKTMERFSASLIPQASEDLEKLREITGMSKTDLVNRAISLLAFVETQKRKGQDLLLRSRSDGTMQLVQLL